MTVIKVRLIPSGIKELMNSTAIQSHCLKEAQKIADRAEGDAQYKVDVQPGETRCHARISTDTVRDYVKELRTNRLLKALWG